MILLFSNPAINFSLLTPVWFHLFITCNYNDLLHSLLKLIVLFASIFWGLASIGQSFTGTVRDAVTDELLVGATVMISGTTTGTVTDLNGRFTLPVEAFPVSITVKFVGYDDTTFSVYAPASNFAIKLTPANLNLDAVEVKANRISEERQKQPLTVATMDLIAIKQTPSASFYDGLGNLAGVDLTTASLGFKVINTRGFNSTSPVRSLQLIDGVDNQSPGLNFSLGNFLGASELDIMKVELIQGAASAFYGPNAFNGVIAMTTKDPFVHRGLDAMVKAGERSMLESAVRWANHWKNADGLPALAYKLNFFYLRANDWEATNYDPVDGSAVPQNNPGRYDAVNIYGDEFYPLNDASGTQPWSDEAGLGTFFRTGYRETDLLDYNTENIKANAVLSWRLQPEEHDSSAHLIIASSFGNGTTVYQGDNRFSLRDILFFQNRIELKKEHKYFLRVYATHEDAGNSYDPYATALRLQELIKDDEDWSLDYRTYWKGNISKKMRANGYPDLKFDPNTGQFTFDQEAANNWVIDYHDSLVAWHRLAESFANTNDSVFLQPGTAAFQQAFDRITAAKNNNTENGTLFYDKSALYHAQGEYMWELPYVDAFRTGVSARLYTPNSDGTIFSDTAGRRITNFEYGFYAGADKRIVEDKVTLSATIRVDKNQNFRWIATPAASVVWNPAKDNYLRFSFSSALRNPTLADQYLYLDVGPAILSGNLEGADSLITLESFADYRNTLNTDTLAYFSIDPVQPEQVRTVEIGYRTILWESLYIDAGYYFNQYRNFLGFNIGIDADFGNSGFVRDLQVYRYAANSRQKVTTQGFTIGIKYFFGKYSLNGNYSWNKLNAFEEDPIIPAFNTPEHKFNIGFGGRSLRFRAFGRQVRNISFNINYKWVQGFLFEGSPQFTGFIPTYDLLDAQINWYIEDWNTTFKLGATNVLDQEQFQTYGGPRVGRLAYLSVQYAWQKTD